MNNELIEKTKTHFLESFKNKTCVVSPYLPQHVSEVEKWAKRILKDYPNANEEVVLFSVWLHDIGRTVGEEGEDHAIKSEREARRFLQEMGIAPETINKVAYCVRAHRCNDVQPETLEAKILAAADSVSHMTNIDYIVMFSFVSKEKVIEKLERDYRDASLLPGLQKEVTPLYEAWKNLLKVYLV